MQRMLHDKLHSQPGIWACENGFMTDELRWSAFTDAELRRIEAGLEYLMDAAPPDDLARALFRSVSTELARRSGRPLHPS